ncbi:phosphoribosylaminoimidazolesuccinocarboxamide synthase [Candidatus Gracilibacteria bacterium]|nr:phosphoribosylaminoimidazolesuccinocarboxamide synthase [Candidatus Gracilibacteria bacterium]MCF7855998.1 phosphoribosylaminoimidazolesuccinocarboxamide synthase [Candidatus Gracilibacteria bacterium]MCF7896309.1 phosphoribosylaminoimidazolesuccinocarboxamide synthase [Candidatus Gracilibacteria bacterium]
MIDPKIIAAQIPLVLLEAEFPELPNHYKGKVRENYDLPDGKRILISTDRQSAFDKVLAAVPFKGQVLTQTAKFWFEKTADICPNHALEYPDPNVVIARRLKMLPVEIIVRDYLTGSTDTSVWTAYSKGNREFCGNKLPEGLKKNDKLPEVILTPSTKPTDGTHDISVVPSFLVENDLVSQKQWDELASISLKLFARGQAIAAQNGLILVDTKYEFGVDENNMITLADEIHTPDSSRYWKADSYEARHAAGEEPESLDKEFLRLWIRTKCDPYNEQIPAIPEDVLVEFSQKYINLFETVTGQEFQLPDLTVSVKERIKHNLLKYFPQT